MMWNNDWNGWGWAGWCLMGLTIALTAGAVIWAVLATNRGNSPRPNDEAPDADELLARRLARGEITEDEYRRQRELIGHGQWVGSPAARVNHQRTGE